MLSRRCSFNVKNFFAAAFSKKHFLLLLLIIQIPIYCLPHIVFAKEEISIGVLAYRGKQQAINTWKPTADYLTRSIPDYTFTIIPLNNDDISKMVENKKIDFVITNPASYATLEALYGVTRINTMRTLRNNKEYIKFGAVIFTRADRKDIKQFKDLKGKLFMAVHPEAFGGWWMAWGELKKHGIDPVRDFKSIKFSGFPQDNIVYAVKNGVVDAGTVRTDILESMESSGLIDLKEFRILNEQTTEGFQLRHSTRLYPEWAFASLKHTPSKISKEVSIALLRMTPDSRAAIFSKIFGWTIPLDYQPVDDLMRQLNVGPYKEFGKITIQSFLQRYWVWAAFILIFVLFLLGVILHILRLNRRLKSSKAFLEKEVSERKKVEEKLTRLGRILDQSSNEIYLFEAETFKFIQVSHGAQANLHYTPMELSTMTLRDIKPEFTESAFREKIEPLIKQQTKQLQFETQQQRKDGSVYDVDVCLQYFSEEGQKIIVAVIQDITEKKKIERDLLQQRQHAKVTLEAIGDAVITTDVRGHIEYLNPVAQKMMECKFDQVKGQYFLDVVQLVDEEMKIAVYNPVERCLKEGKFSNFGIHSVLLGRGGKETAVQETVSPYFDVKGNLQKMVLTFRDVTELRRLQNQMVYYSTHDDLTGLMNRREFEKQLDIALKSAYAESKQHILMYLDLDQFKVVNDTGGHVVGDAFLKELASSLKLMVRGADTLARLGGDEFGILLWGCDFSFGKKVADQIIEGVSDFRYTRKKHDFQTSVSIGISLINKESGNLTDVMARADAACYVAKDFGRNRAHIYSAEDKALKEYQDQMQWVPKIRKALENNYFCLFAQPIVPLCLKDKDFGHLEILVRMLNDKNDLISPFLFIPAAERYQLMPQVDQWVIQKTFVFIKKNEARMPKNFIYNINLSGQSLCEESFTHWALAEIQNLGTLAKSVCFEITETAAVSNFQKALEFISRLHSMGCSLALDDFGKGLSSFSYLKQIQADYLKIDGSFVKNITESKKDYALIQAIHEIGKRLSMKTVAEFVEDDQILSKLKELGVDYGQGYGIAKPKPLKDFLK